MLKKAKMKNFSVMAVFEDVEVYVEIRAASLPKAFKKFARQWHMDDVLEIGITEVKSDERSEGISGEDQVVRCSD